MTRSAISRGGGSYGDVVDVVGEVRWESVVLSWGGGSVWPAVSMLLLSKSAVPNVCLVCSELILSQ
jgi:hypothetical protein